MTGTIRRVPPPPPREASALEVALGQMRLRLLDLTGRNRLLNFRHTAGKSLQFVEGHLATIYDKLVEGTNRASISILGLPERRPTQYHCMSIS